MRKVSERSRLGHPWQVFAMRYTLVLILIVLVPGCPAFDMGPIVPTGTLPAVVQLHVGQSFMIPEEGYTVTFDKVTEDSRCPIGLMCFWEGDGATKMTIRHQTVSVQNCTLHTTLDPKSINFGKFFMRLKNLDPYPKWRVQIDPRTYVATVEIDWADKARN